MRRPGATEDDGDTENRDDQTQADKKDPLHSIERDGDKPRLALNNITAGVRERQDVNRTREAGHLDEIQGVVAITLNLFRNGAVGFIDWLDANDVKITLPVSKQIVGFDFARSQIGTCSAGGLK
jgi:hypothetical protein